MLQLAIEDAGLFVDESAPAIKGQALEEIAKEYVLITNISKRLARRYDSEILEAMLFSEAGKDAPTSSSANTWLEKSCELINDKFNGTRNYHAQAQTLDGDDWAIRITRRMHGVDHDYILSKDFFASPEIKKLFSLNQKLDGLLNNESYIQRGERRQYVSRFDKVMSWLMKEGQRGLNIQRYKGLGEMNPDQLWDTTMDPERRRMLQVTIQDAYQADEIFTTLMGDHVEPRREFIERNALNVANLDV